MKLPERLLDSGRHRDLERALLGLRKEVSLRRYLARAIYASIAVSAAALVGGYFLLSFSGMDQMSSIFLAILMGFGLGPLTYWAFTKYPSIALSGRRVQIETMLPHTATYMYSLSKGGSEIVDIFRSVAQDESQGEMAKEAKAVIRNIEYLGHNPISAIREVARTTPSEKFRNFLELLASTVATGGDVQKYFERTSKQFCAEAGAAQRRALDTLSLMAEFYVIILGLGPLLIMVFIILFGMIGGIPMPLVYMFVYFVIPFLFAFFLLFLSRFSVSPGHMKPPKRVETKEAGPGRMEIARIFQGGGFSRAVSGLRRKFSTTPSVILLLSVPAAIIFGVLQYQFGQFDTGTVVFSVLIAVVPFAVLYEVRRSRREKIEDTFPDFLMTLSSSIASGLTPTQAIKSTSAAALGPLSSEMERVTGEIEWGTPTSEALSKFEDRVGSGIVKRLVGVIRKAMAASGEISDVVDILALDASTARSLKQERRGAMVTYIIVVYMSVIVFIFTAGMIATSLFAFGPTGENAVITGAAVAGMTEEMKAQIKVAMFHSALIQAFLSGLVAGQLGAGDVWSGLKHSVLLMIIAYLIFSVWVMAA